MERELIRVAIVEDDPDWLRGLTDYIDGQLDMKVVGHADTGRKAIELLEGMPADVVLMDIMMAGNPEGIWATAEITQCTGAKVIMLSSMEEQELIFEAFKVGAVDYIVKSNFEEIPDAVRSAYRNKTAIHPSVAETMRQEFRRLKQLEQDVRMKELRNLLTPMELQVLSGIGQGYTQTQIADSFFISIRTVKIHVGHILRKLDCKTSKDAAMKAKEMGIL